MHFRTTFSAGTNPISTAQFQPQPLTIKEFTTLHTQNPKTERTQTNPIFSLPPNPILARSFFRKSLGLQKNLFMGSKPNFKNQENTASTCKRETYTNLHPQTNNKSKPNPNPIQTQFQTQSQLSTLYFLPSYSLGPTARRPIQTQSTCRGETQRRRMPISDSVHPQNTRNDYVLRYIHCKDTLLECLLCYYRTRWTQKTSTRLNRASWTC